MYFELFLNINQGYNVFQCYFAGFAGPGFMMNLKFQDGFGLFEEFLADFVPTITSILKFPRLFAAFLIVLTST
jgi:hypothetical protein